MSNEEYVADNELQFDKFRKNVSDLLQSKGILGKELASEIGITPATLSRYLKNKRDPDLEYVYRIAKYMGVTIDWLLGVSEEKTETLSPDIKHFSELYAHASEEDQAVVQTVLRKYEAFL